MTEPRIVGYLAHGARRISVLSLAADGSLTKIDEAVVNDSDIPEDVRAGRFTTLTVSHDRRFLFVANRTAPYSFRSFAINSEDGTLTLLGETPTVESSPYLSTDRTGRFLLAAYNPPDRNRRTGFLSVSTISNGFIQPAHQVLRTPPKTHAIVLDQSNRFAFAPSCDGNQLLRFTFDQNTGLLDPNPLAPVHIRPDSGPRHVIYHPSNRFAYMLNEYDASIYAYSFDARDGAMSELQVASVRPAALPKDENPRSGDLRVSPDGKWLFAALRSNNTIAVLSVDQRSGLLTNVGAYPVDKEPRGFNLDPTGRFLVVNGLMTRTAVTFRIDPESGELERVASFDTDEDPNWLEFVQL